MPLLARQHTVVAIDVRGAGHSDSPQGGYGTMAVLDFPRYAVCGHDIGAIVAVALACTRRKAVAHLTILDAPMPGWSEWEAFFADPKVWYFSFHMKRDLPERLLFGREYDYVSTFIFDRAFHHGAHTTEDLEIFARAFAQPGNTRGGLEWYRAFPTDHADALAWKRQPLTIPVLALSGEHRYGPMVVSIMESFVTNVSGGSIADCAHWLPEERPVETANAMLAFLVGGS